MSLIKNCPRCGYDICKVHTEIGGTSQKQVQCAACQYQSGFFQLKEQAIAHWNATGDTRWARRHKVLTDQKNELEKELARVNGEIKKRTNHE